MGQFKENGKRRMHTWTPVFITHICDDFLSRPGEIKPDLTGDLHNDSCNASDTSDYKSSSC